jgi:tRNA dimethylallyltransferase
MSARRAPLLVIAGPTGVGKTAVAVALAQRLPIEVISADSRQVYRGMDVATGKPTAAERAAAVHHLIDVVDPDEGYHAARFAAEATEAIGAIRRRGRLPVIVGGTGLYIRALLRGLDPAPPADPEFRRELASIAAAEGRPALHARLAQASPATARRLHPNDAVRVVRALELLRAGSPVGEARTRWRQEPALGAVLYIGLTMARQTLVQRLEARAAAMVAAGLAREVRGLLDRGYGPELPALHSIGYREFARVLAGALDEAEALRLMQRDTARYARRQWTWFAREPAIEWIDAGRAGSAEAVAATIEARMNADGGGIE